MINKATLETPMKTTKALFGILTITAALLGMVVPTNAESFIGPTSSTNRFIIGTNESVLITRAALSTGGRAGSKFLSLEGSVVVKGTK